MKKILGLLGVFIVFLLIVFAAVAIVPPVGLAKKIMIGGLRQATGLELQINGPTRLRLVPSIELHMEDVVVSNPSLAGSKPPIAAKVIEASSSWSSFFCFFCTSRSIDRIALTDPVIDLATDARGRNSWEALLAAATRDPSAARVRAPFYVGRIEVTGGTIDYRDQRNGLATRLERTQATLREVSTDRLGEVLVKAGAAVFREQAGGTAVDVAGLDAVAKDVAPARLGSVVAAGETVRWRSTAQPGGVEATKLKVGATRLGFDGAEALTLGSGSMRWRDQASGGTLDAGGLEATALGLKGGRLDGVAFKSAALAFQQAGAGVVSASGVSGAIKTATSNRLEGVAIETASLGIPQAATRSPGQAAAASPFELQQASFATLVLAFGTPIDAAVGFVHNKDRITGNVKLPAPEAIGAGPAIPANVSLKASRGSVDFDGRIETGANTVLKGRTRATTTSVDALANWLGIAVPATLKGAVNVSGDVDAQASRVALANSRIEHGTNAMTGSFAVDLAGPRPKLSGRVAADKLDADVYLGLEPVKPRPGQQAGGQPRPQSAARPEKVEPEVELGDVFKSYVRGMLSTPPKRSGTLEFPDLKDKDLIPAATRSKPKSGSFAWNEERFDLSVLRALDLDLDWSVKSLSVRGMELNVPQLKTHLDAGALTLEGRDLVAQGGRISGRAQVDARGNVPAMSANVQGSGVDFQAISEAFGIPPMLGGSSAVEANVTASGNSQKQLVQSLSGKVKSETPQGRVIGYDLGSLNILTLGSWISGSREYDPSLSTPISGLKADLDIDKGVVRDSQVSLGGPILGVNAEGTVELVEQRLDYSGRARITTLLSGLAWPFKIFGDWSRPSLQPDLPSLTSVFSRSAPGGPDATALIEAATIKPDPELALMIGQVIQRAGPTGLDPATRAVLLAVQKKALGN